VNLRATQPQEPRSDAPIDLLARLAHTERAAAPAREPEPAPARKPWALIAVAIVSSAALSSLLTAGLSGKANPVATTAAPAAVTPAQAVASAPGQPVALEAAGYVVARNKSSVSSDITGRIKSISVVVGQSVKQGEVIANLDDREALLRLNAAEIRLTQSRLAAENARVLLQHEGDKLAKLKQLAGQNYVSDAAYKQVTAAHDTAAIQVRAADAQKAEAENALAAARIFVERHVIRAPFSGIVSAMSASAGETVSPTSGGANSFIRSGIVQLVDPVSLYVVAEVPERQVQPIHVGQKVEVAGKSAGANTFTSTVTWVAPVSNRQRGVVEVGIDLTDPSRRFIDGMEVSVRFINKQSDKQ
jgi:HlyD family secretion protein